MKGNGYPISTRAQEKNVLSFVQRHPKMTVIVIGGD